MNQKRKIFKKKLVIRFATNLKKILKISFVLHKQKIIHNSEIWVYLIYLALTFLKNACIENFKNFNLK